MIIEIKWRDNFIGNKLVQIDLLPFIDIFWNDGAYCIAIGWLIGGIEFWFRNRENK